MTKKALFLFQLFKKTWGHTHTHYTSPHSHLHGEDNLTTQKGQKLPTKHVAIYSTKPKKTTSDNTLPSFFLFFFFQDHGQLGFLPGPP